MRTDGATPRATTQVRTAVLSNRAHVKFSHGHSRLNLHSACTRLKGAAERVRHVEHVLAVMGDRALHPGRDGRR